MEAVLAISRKNRIWKRIGIWTSCVLLVAVAAVCAVSVYVGWVLTHPDRLLIQDNPQNFNLKYENIHFPSKNDLTLKGWFLPGDASGANRGKTIIFAHGIANNRLEPEVPALQIASRLVEKGFNVLMFDFRNSGESEGSLTSVGYFEKDDLLSAIEYVKGKVVGGKIGLLGFSMGASVSLLAAAESNDIRAVVADSPFADLKQYLNDNLDNFTDLPKYPFTPIIMYSIPIITGIKLEKVSPISAMQMMNEKRVLLIHGEKDRTISSINSEKLYEAVKDRNQAELWLVPDTDHVYAHANFPNKYEDKVLNFFERM
ncbi:alpha/beta hydrolase fold protein [Paenibacillus curdlanolyticus YK9]|uniref:Alpha/beta hydrolase fold protein n=1 Tax=Paenibacillus curdlanolyticus YK9 TaxID=717606 RepID=E0I742_9BACL|nr:alpha/beta fold hydrolase [Paenibacillus curdlanolyticus]EFM11858.1 alpha/beta hydrolase fold protein [Paenibacillus curdlanolyticus YK9]